MTDQSNPLAKYPLHQNPDQVPITRGDEVIGAVPCQRMALEGQQQPYHRHTTGAIGRTSDGTIYTAISNESNVLFSSSNEGQTWTCINDDLPQGMFTVLNDGSLSLAGSVANENGQRRMSFHRSTDRGQTWDRTATLDHAPFDILDADGNLIQLQDGTLLMPVQYRANNDIDPDRLQKMYLGGLWTYICAQYVIRSDDNGQTWQSGVDQHFWSTLIDLNLNIFSLGPHGRTPGPGGTFPGCYETGLTQLPSGRIMAALRYSGPPQPWHHDVAEAWKAGEPDVHGRMFRTVLLSASDDNGITWEPIHPVTDAAGQTLLQMNDSNGELLCLPDGRLMLIYTRRDPNDAMQLMAIISSDNGQTWQPEAYRLQAGFGYPQSLALEDGTIITTTGRAVNDKTGKPLIPFDAQAIRWKPKSA